MFGAPTRGPRMSVSPAVSHTRTTRVYCNTGVLEAPRTAVHDRGRREVPGHTSTTFILHTHERLPRQEGRYQVTPTSVFTVCTMLSLCFLGLSPAAAGPDVCAAAAFWIFSSAWNARCAFRASLDVNRCSRPCAPECRGGCQGGGAPARAERGGAHRTAALPLARRHCRAGGTAWKRGSAALAADAAVVVS